MDLSSIDRIQDDFHESLLRAKEITELNDEILTHVINSLNSIRSIAKISNPSNGADVLRNQIDLLNRIMQNPVIQEKLPILYEQQLILGITAFEVFIGDLIRDIGKSYRRIVKSSEFNGKKIDYALLSDEESDIGDILYSLVTKEKITLKSLPAVSEIFGKYFGITLSLDESWQATFGLSVRIRDLFLHSGGKVNTRFLNSEYVDSTKYKKDSQLVVAAVEVNELIQACQNIVENITSKTKERIIEAYDT